MKKVACAVMITAMTLSFSSVGLAAGGADGQAAVEQSAAKVQNVKPQSFTGVVKAVDGGVALQTVDGVFPLEGLDIKELVDQEVVITGVMRGQKQNSSIFVMKAAVKS